MKIQSILKSVLSLCLIAFSLGACIDDDMPGVNLSGIVKNTTDIGISQANVSLWIPGESTASFSTTTNEEGGYTFSGVPEGEYELHIQATGYNDYLTLITLSGNPERIDVLTGNATISGQIINSQTGGGLGEAEVSFTFGTDTIREEADLVVITDANGYYIVEGAPVGIFIQVIRHENFFTTVVEDVNVEEGVNNLPPTTAVETVEAGALRIVLTWGLSPSDLDSHLTGPETGGGRFHCYFDNQYPNEQVNLDVDDIYSYGPETTTIIELVTGTYRYSVHNYSNQSSSGSQDIAASPAKVEIFGIEGKLASFSPPPSTPGNTWRVFEMEVSTEGINIIPIHTYVTAAHEDDTGTFRVNGKLPIEDESIF